MKMSTTSAGTSAGTHYSQVAYHHRAHRVREPKHWTFSTQSRRDRRVCSLSASFVMRSVRLPPSLKLRRTAVALAEAGQADRHRPAKPQCRLEIRAPEWARHRPLREPLDAAGTRRFRTCRWHAAGPRPAADSGLARRVPVCRAIRGARNVRVAAIPGPFAWSEFPNGIVAKAGPCEYREMETAGRYRKTLHVLKTAISNFCITSSARDGLDVRVVGIDAIQPVAAAVESPAGNAAPMYVWSATARGARPLET